MRTGIAQSCIVPAPAVVEEKIAELQKPGVRIAVVEV